MSESWLRIQNNLADYAVDHVSHYGRLSLYRWLTANLVVFAFVFAGLQLNAFTIETAPMWFASGAAAAFMFMRGITIVTGIALGAFSAYWYAGVSSPTALIAASIWCLQSYLLFKLTFSIVGPSLIFKQRRQSLAFILSSALITALSTLFLILICLDSSAITVNVWFNWWLANWNGVLVFAVSVYTWDYYFPEIHDVPPSVKIKLAAKLFVMLLVAFMLFSTQDLTLILYLSSAICAIVIWNKYQHGWCGGMISLFVFAMLLVGAHLLNANSGYLATLLTLTVLIAALIPAAS